MGNILIVGSITKDIYLRLDNRKNNFETDQNGVKWLDLAFDGTTHQYYSRAPIYGGASISLEVLIRFGHKAKIAGTSASFVDGQFITDESNTIYRYILCQDNDVSYISPNNRRNSTWEVPESDPDWIYIDRSATISPDVATEILNYLSLAPKVKLAMFVSKHTNQNAPYIEALIKRADLIVADAVLRHPRSNIAFITKKYIEYMNQRVNWSMKNKSDFITQLSAHQNIGASIVGAIALDRNVDDTLLLARGNVMDSTLGNTINLATLENKLMDDYYFLEKHNSANYQTKDLQKEVEENAKKLVSEGKGILAADESGGSIHKKFESMNIPDDEQHRRDYRNIFFTTPDLEKYVNGVILFDETARQTADDGRNFVEFLSSRGIIPGIKVDQGLVDLGTQGEKYTQGLEGLPQRLEEYYNMGARFAKWRAAFELTPNTPSGSAIWKNCQILANYAVACQKAGIVPIVEPELVYDGDYPIDKCATTTYKILKQLFTELELHKVNLKGCILKVNMVLEGKKRERQSTPEEVGKNTADVLRAAVPKDLAGVVFLSGGQSVEQATANLQAVTNNGPFPWPVTFSFARALQDPALQAWKGDNANCDAAREAFKERLIANCEALKKKD